MKFEKILHYDAFTSIINKGNPAGIVLGADKLNKEEMQTIAKKIGFNETVFILKSDKADLRLKYFTPGHEMNLCGHATIGSLYCLKKLGKLSEKEAITVETNIGILPIKFQNKNNKLYITMKQDKPKFKTFNGNIELLAKSMGLTKNDIDLVKPIVYGNTGTWTLLIPIKKLETFKKMKPENKLFPEILKEIPKSSIHPFCLETYDENAFMHARHFSSPYSGTIEDAVTGTASGVMGAYYLNFINKNLDSFQFTVEQGFEIDKNGRVFVEVKRLEETMDVYISGTAVFVKEILLENI